MESISTERNENKPPARRRRRLKGNLIWTALNAAVALSLISGLLLVHGEREQRDSTSREHAPVALAAPTVQDTGEMVARADALLNQGMVGRAAEVYGRVVAREGSVAHATRYRIAVCFELLGQRDEALSSYRDATGSTDAVVAAAGRLGQARLHLAAGNVAACQRLSGELLTNSALPEVQASGIDQDASYLLALARTKQALRQMPSDRLNPASMETPAVVFHADHLLSLISDRDEPPAATHVALPSQPTGLQILALTHRPETTSVAARYQQVEVTNMLRDLATSTSWKVAVSPKAQSFLKARTVRVHVESMPMSSLLTLVLEPVELAWKFSDAGLTIQRTSELPAKTLAAIQLQQATAALRISLSLSPDHPLASHAQIALGNLAAEQGERDRAAAHYRETGQRQPGHPNLQTALFNLGKTLLLQDQEEKAVAAFYRVIDERTGHELEAAAYLFLGRIHLDSGDNRSAERELSRALSLATNQSVANVACVTLATAYLMSDQPHSANLTLMERRDALRTGESTEMAAFLSAVARFRTSSEAALRLSGRDVIASLVRVSPRDFFGDMGYLLLGAVYTELGYEQLVMQTFQEALSRRTAPWVADQARLRLARLYMGQGEYSQAQGLLAAVWEAKATPLFQEARLEMARLSFQQGSLEECYQICQDALHDLRLQETRLEFLRLLGKVYEVREDHYNAAVCFAGLTPVVPGIE